MAADDDAPDVDYEGEEEVEHADSHIALPIKPGAGDSETEDEDDDDDDDAAGPPPPAAMTPAAVAAPTAKKLASTGNDGATTMDNDKTAVAALGFRPPPSSKMDRALDAPRETSNVNYTSCHSQNSRGYENSRRNNDENRNGAINHRGTMKRQPENNDDVVGVYIPPAKRRLMEEQRKVNNNEAEASNPASMKQQQVTPMHIQRQTWENLQRCINGTINRLSPSTIKPLIHALFTDANLVRGRGLLARSIMKATSGSPQYAPTYAALMAVVNTKLPECGELLLTRAILLFRQAYKYRDRNTVSSTLALLGHMFNQGMAHELLSLQILTLLLDGDPTEDSVDVAVGYMCIVGRQLTEVSPAGVHAVMERFRGLLHEGSIGRRAQYRIETLLKIKKGAFQDYPTIPDEENLDLVEREDQITFELGLDDEGLNNEEGLDVFRFDDEYDEKEEEWAKIKAEILGVDDDDDESGSGSGSESGSESEEGDEDEAPTEQQAGDKKTVVIEDLTETDLVHLRRTIYLTIMSSATFEECTHKLAKMDIPPGRECELINMIIECCSQERTFLRYYGLVSGRFCLLHERWRTAFEQAFAKQYSTIHRLETNKLRNVAKLFGHLLHTDSFSWAVLGCIHLNEDETTSSSRIFIKILIQEMAEAMGMVTLKQRFDTDNSEPDGHVGEDAPPVAAIALPGRRGQDQHEPSSREWFRGMFPKDNARNTRYAINFFTSIGLGPLTDGMREFLKNAPKLILAQAQAQAARDAAQKEREDDESSVISTSSSDTSSVSSSSSGSSVSSSSYTSSYSSYSADRRKKSSAKRNGGRRRGDRSSSSYSSYSSSGSDSSPSRDRGRKKYSSKDSAKRSRSRHDSVSCNDRDRGAGKHSGKASTPDTSNKKRSVSESPPRVEGRKGGNRRDSRRRRSYSSSRSGSSGNGYSSERQSNGDGKRKESSRSSSHKNVEQVNRQSHRAKKARS
ncbi:hypothetical protein ACHAXH_008525 [Discostella pseudostelligera]